MCRNFAQRREQRPEYFLLPVRSILNKCDSNRVPFEWTINPYRGCEFACKYCYARYTHEYMELDGGEFEKKIFVKQNAAPLLAQDVRESIRTNGPGRRMDARSILRSARQRIRISRRSENMA